MNTHYENMASPPKDALKKIDAGTLKGKSDINPQWRYEALTEEFGLCGIGWKFEIVNTFTETISATQEIMIFVQVNLYVKEGDEWSAPIPGFGGDFLIKKDKNGIHGNDEGFKMAVTDALGTAAKMIGVAATVYRGLMDSKYSSRTQTTEAPKTKTKAAPKIPTKQESSDKLRSEMARLHIGKDEFLAILNMKFHKSWDELTDAETADLADNLSDYSVELVDEDSKLMEGVA